MFQTFKNAWKIPSLRNKLLFTLMIVLLYRVGANLFVPFVNTDLITSQQAYTNLTTGIFGLINLFSGGAFEQATFFALSVSPYITASIVMQLLCIAIPALEKLSKDGGEEGKKKINAITRIVTVVLALVTAYGYVQLLASNSLLLISKTSGADNSMYYFGMAVMVACFCAGAAIIMWMAERIDQYGVGNGISIILFANIISRGGSLVTSVINMMKNTSTGAWLTGGKLAVGIVEVVISVALALVTIGLIIWFTNSEERIRIQYAKRVQGRKMMGGQSSNLPLKLNMAGVMPIIFASSIVSILPTIANFTKSTSKFYQVVNAYFTTGTPVYIVSYIVLIFLFSYFYIMISFNPIEVANNIRANGGSIKGFDSTKRTADYIKKHLNRITTMGAVFLAVIAGVPMIVGAFAPSFTTLAFSGTSLLIVVGVALETAHDIEAQMKLRNYKGFLG